MVQGEKKKKGTLAQIRKQIKTNYFFYLIMIPGIVILIMFCYMPMAGIYLAFENYSYEGGLFGSEFVGLDNFKFLFFNANKLLRAVRNTLVINIGSIILGNIVNVAFAIIFNEIGKERFRKIGQSLAMLPYLLSWVCVGTLSEVLLSNKYGVINKLLEMLGRAPINWYVSAKYWWVIIIIASVWKGVGYGSIVYYATITGFDPGIYEAAKVDGASRFKQITKITLPMLKPTIALMLLLNVGGILGGSLDQIAGMTKLNGYLLETTDTVTTFVYRMTMEDVNFGMSAASSLFQSLFGCVFVLTANLIAKKIDPDYALF